MDNKSNPDAKISSKTVNEQQLDKVSGGKGPIGGSNLPGLRCGMCGYYDNVNIKCQAGAQSYDDATCRRLNTVNN